MNGSVHSIHIDFNLHVSDISVLTAVSLHQADWYKLHKNIIKVGCMTSIQEENCVALFTGSLILFAHILTLLKLFNYLSMESRLH